MTEAFISLLLAALWLALFAAVMLGLTLATRATTHPPSLGRPARLALPASVSASLGAMALAGAVLPLD